MFTLDCTFGDEPLRSNTLDPGVISTKQLHAGWALGGEDVSVGVEEVYATVMEIEKKTITASISRTSGPQPAPQLPGTLFRERSLPN